MPADLPEDTAFEAERKDKGHWGESLWGGGAGAPKSHAGRGPQDLQAG